MGSSNRSKLTPLAKCNHVFKIDLTDDDKMESRCQKCGCLEQSANDKTIDRDKETLATPQSLKYNAVMALEKIVLMGRNAESLLELSERDPVLFNKKIQGNGKEDMQALFQNVTSGKNGFECMKQIERLLEQGAPDRSARGSKMLFNSAISPVGSNKQRFSNNLSGIDPRLYRDSFAFERSPSKLEVASYLPDEHMLFIDGFKMIAANAETLSKTEIQHGRDFGTIFPPNSVITSNNRMFVCGGDGHEKETFEYDFGKRRFLRRAMMKEERRCHAFIQFNINVLVAIGGRNTFKQELDSCEAFDILKNKWLPICSLTQKKEFVTAFSISSKVMYVTSGDAQKPDHSMQYFNTFERNALGEDYLGQWEVINVQNEKLLKPCSNMGFYNINDKEVLLFGGDNNGRLLTQSIIFNTETNELRNTEKELQFGDKFYQCSKIFHNNSFMIISNSRHMHVFKDGKWNGVKHFLTGVLRYGSAL